MNTKKLNVELTTAYFDYSRMLFGHALRKTDDQHLSENIVQDTFMKTWVYLVKNGKIDLMRAFLFHVLKNLIVDQYRKPKTTSLDLLLENNLEPMSGNSGNIHDYIDGKALILLINKLPEKYKKIMQMRYADDLSLDEMSVLTGKTNNALAVQTHRGLKKLKLLYDHAPK